MRKRRYWRFAWSHEASLHRALVRIYNALLRRVPVGLKYGVGLRLRRTRSPYSLVSGRTVVQVGAPRDMLDSGRSRAAYFAMLAGENGRVIIIEPDGASADALRRFLTLQKLDNAVVVQRGAWSDRAALRVHVDPKHPATSFTDGVKEVSARRAKEYRTIEVPADSIDNILDDLRISHVDLVSITTNGAEREILAGLERTIGNGLRFVALADTGVVTQDDMRRMGFRLFDFDDRGRIYIRA